MILQEILRSMYISCWTQSRLLLHHMETILPFLSFLIVILKKAQQLLCIHILQPSTSLQKIVKTSKASVVYKKEIAEVNCCYKKEIAEANCLSEQVPNHMPRDLKQLQNLRFKHLNESRISRDDLYNLHEITYDHRWRKGG